MYFFETLNTPPLMQNELTCTYVYAKFQPKSNKWKMQDNVLWTKYQRTSLYYPRFKNYNYHKILYSSWNINFGLSNKFCIYICTCKFILHQGRGIQWFKEVHVYSLVRFSTCTCTSPYWNMTLFKVHMVDFQKNEDFSFSENNFNIKWYERKVNILKQAQW
jgi:hypothetical protein